MAGEGGARVSLAWDDLTEPFPSWVELDKSRTASVEVRRGRQDEFDRCSPGTASVLAHDLGTLGLDPTGNGDMPLHGMIDLFDPVAATWSTIYRGNVESDSHDLDASMLVVRSELTLVDALDYLAGFELAPGLAGHTLPAWVEDDNVYYEEDPVDDRIYAALADAGWPTELTSIFSGNVTVRETVYSSGTPALSVIQDAADAEFPGVANLYVSRDGQVRFRGRFARFNPDNPQYGVTRWTASTGDGAGAQMRPPFRFSRSRQRGRLVNAALAIPQDVGAVRVSGVVRSDPDSVNKYGLRSWSAESLLTKHGQSTGFDDENETVLFADYYVDNLSVPRARIDELTFRSIHPDHPKAAATWALICGVEIGDIVEVTTDHPGGGFADQPFYVEGIAYRISPLNGDYANVTLTLDVSPASLYDANPFG